MTKLTDYEEKICDEIAHHVVSPNPFQRALSLAEKPMAALINGAKQLPILKQVPSLVQSGVSKGMVLAMKGAQVTYKEEAILNEMKKRRPEVSSLSEFRNLPLEDLDAVADRYRVSNGIFVTAQGLGSGLLASVAELVPGAQWAVPAVITSDVIASTVLLSRATSQVAGSYGFSPSTAENIPHAIAAMIPQTHLDEESYFSLKAAVYVEIREASKFISSVGGKKLENLVAKNAVPSLVRLINLVTTRLEVSITEKELALLLPAVGALLNGAVNLAFQQTGHLSAKDYFRMQILNERYGKEQIEDRVRDKIIKLRAG
jgi:hypothetical protein